MKIAKEGIPYILIALIIEGCFIILINNGYENIVIDILVVLIGLIILFMLFFFRFPNRRQKYIDNENIILSPSDGKVMLCEVVSSKHFNTDVYRIVIFLSVFNVHVNWSPMSGRVSYIKHRLGAFDLAWKEGIYATNEHYRVIIKDKNRSMSVSQIAGFVARRIVNYFVLDQWVKLGQIMGIIMFGSSVELLIPISASIKVKKGDKVKGCRTIIAEWPG